jgi:hypothetical protein
LPCRQWCFQLLQSYGLGFNLVNLKYMLYQAEILFRENELPSPEEILERVRLVSGLFDVELSKKTVNCKFVHSAFPDVGFVFYQADNSYKLLFGEDELNYLGDVTIAVLVDLGGVYKHELPEWSRKQWEEVRHKF